MEDRARPERIATRGDLAAALTTVRVGAGWSVRALAAELGLAPATVGDYVSGRRLPAPSRMEDFRRLLVACGVQDEGAMKEWVEAVLRVRRATDRRLNHGA